MKKFLKPVFYIPLILIVVIGVIWSLGKSNVNEVAMITVQAQQGSFVAKVYATGQLQAENATSINVPSALSGRRLGIYEIAVSEIVDEGTVVDSGEFVASLDHSAVEELMTEAREDLEKSLEQFEDAKIDTNINMSNLRDGLLNGRVEVEEKKLILEQSVYESPAVKRQANLDLERAGRNLEQSLRNYELKQQQAEYDVARSWEEVRKHQERVNEINLLFETLEVKAPKPGMVIYSLDRFGNKIEAGSTVSRWSPRIAELPDLSTMISKTFINEIDVSRVRAGQQVQVGIDAFPEKSFSGRVVSVANIGQMLPSGDTKVFEVIIKVFGSDDDLRPAMTTSNVITTDSMANVTFIPIEAIFKNDTASFVYLKERSWIKQIVDAGAENANHVVISQGVEAGQLVSLTPPSNAFELPVKGVEIYNDMQEKARQAAKDSAVKADDIEKRPSNRPQRPGARGNRNGTTRGRTQGGGR